MVEGYSSVGFDFHGLKVELRSADAKTVEGIGRDFAYFKQLNEKTYDWCYFFTIRTDVDGIVISTYDGDWRK